MCIGSFYVETNNLVNLIIINFKKCKFKTTKLFDKSYPKKRFIRWIIETKQNASYGNRLIGTLKPSTAPRFEPESARCEMPQFCATTSPKQSFIRSPTNLTSAVCVQQRHFVFLGHGIDDTSEELERLRKEQLSYFYR